MNKNPYCAKLPMKLFSKIVVFISGRIQYELSVILLMDVDYREVLHCCAKIKCIAFYIELNFFFSLFSHVFVFAYK